MLRICTKQEFAVYADFVYSLALDKTKSGYPSYCDGIKTKKMFLQRSQEAFSKENEAILLFEYDGAVEGWIHYYALPEDNYLSTVSFNILSHTEQALKEFLDFAKEHFHGFELLLGYSTENTKAIAFLKSNGFERLEESNNNTAFLNRLAFSQSNCSVIRITKENFEPFRSLHVQVENDMYWNSERIYNNIDHWIIFVKLQNDIPVGSVYYMADDDGWYEIFGIDLKENIFDEKVFSDLLEAALRSAKELNGKYMTFFCGDEEQKIVSKLGFDLIDKYVCYKTLLR